MRTATKLEAGIWRLRETGMSYTQIAHKAKVSKGVVASTLFRIRRGAVTLPVVSGHGGRGGCRWVNGDPKRPGWTWCDVPVKGDGAWCVEHHARVYKSP